MASAKIAVVDVQRVIVEVKQGKKAMNKLKAEATKKEKSLKAKSAALVQEQKDIENMAKNPAADREKARAKYQEFMKAYQAFQVETQKMRQELAEKEQKEAKKIYEKIQVVISKIVKKEGFDVVLNSNAVVYVPSSSDITNQVIREYDKVNK